MTNLNTLSAKDRDKIWDKMNTVGLAINQVDTLKPDGKIIKSNELTDVKIMLHLWQKRLEDEYGVVVKRCGGEE